MDKNKKSYHHGNLKEALILSAVEILKTSGYSSLSLRLVAKTAGVSHTAPYSHFNNKEDLYAAIAEYGFDLLTKMLTELDISTISPFEKLKEAIKLYIYFATENPDIYSVMFSKEIKIELFPVLMEKANYSLSLLQKQIEICQEQNFLFNENPQNQTFFVWTVLHGFSEIVINNKIPDIQRSCETKEKLNSDLIIETIINHIFQGIKR